MDKGDTISIVPNPRTPVIIRQLGRYLVEGRIVYISGQFEGVYIRLTFVNSQRA